MRIWEASDDIKKLVEETKTAHHPHLAQAKIWVLVADTKPIKDNKLVSVRAAKCTKTEKLKAGYDFKIMVTAEAWRLLTDAQRAIAIDEALCHCGVKFLPQTVIVNKKPVVVKDDIGRIIYTNEIEIDEDDNPKWRMNQPDMATYFQLLTRYKAYNDDIQNGLNAIEGKPLKTLTPAQEPPEVE